MRRTTLVLTVAAPIGGAGVVHLAVAPAHFQGFFLFGFFFVGVGTAQLTLAAASGASGVPRAFDVTSPVAGQHDVSVASLTAAPAAAGAHPYACRRARSPWDLDLQRHRAGTGASCHPEQPGTGHPGQPSARVDDHPLARSPGAQRRRRGGRPDPECVPPDHRFTYGFVVGDVGTFWYHSHRHALEQVARGLFGALVVEPGRRSGGAGRRSSPGAPRRRRVGPHPASPGQTVRPRVVNAVLLGMDGGPETVALEGAGYRVAALDAGTVDGAVLGPERIRLGMGQRAHLIFTVPLRRTGRARHRAGGSHQTVDVAFVVDSPASGGCTATCSCTRRWGWGRRSPITA